MSSFQPGSGVSQSGFLPFSFFQKKALEKVAASVEIRYLEKASFAFMQGQAAETHFYILKKVGNILTNSIPKSKRKFRRWNCDEVIVLGWSTGKRPVLSAKVAEEKQSCLCNSCFCLSKKYWSKTVE